MSGSVTTTVQSAERLGTRLTSIDALRGAIMIIMALDHVRDFFHRAAMSSSPTDLARTTPLLFFTRWVTHFCAPGFMFTAGLGAYLWWRRGRTRRELSQFLVTRGLWLVILELTVMRVAYDFDVSLDHPFLLLVLWVLGLCMVLLAALVWLPIRWLAVLSGAMIALHNLLDPIGAARFGALAPVWNVLHQPGAFVIRGKAVIVGYPLVPWVAVMALGFCAGPLFTLADADLRRRRLIAIGAAATGAFVIMRAVNVYGDPAAWAGQRSSLFTALSFLNTTKYPPSLAFLLMTLGPLLLALAWIERGGPRVGRLTVYGRVPLFYFMTHFYAAHGAAALFAIVRYGSPASQFMVGPIPSMGGSPKLFPDDFGYELWVAYAVWAAIVVGLYPACRRFAQIKATSRRWWLRYL